MLLGNDGLADSEYVPSREKSGVDLGVIGGEQRRRAGTLGKANERKASDSESSTNLP